MKIELQNKEDCCGCGACASICSKNAITMQADYTGFLYPIIDNYKCIDCGLCSKVCQFKKDYVRYQNFEKPLVFAGRQKDIVQVAKSQTGGLASLLYRHFISNQGFVYGVVVDNNQHVVFKGTDSLDEIENFRGSKYVQADSSKVFKSIRHQLQIDVPVLFIGTPCQVAGLKSYLPKKYHSKLLTVDLVCHCNTSPGLWKSYIQYIEHKYRSTVVKANFRDKRFGWHKCLETYMLQNGKEVVTRSYDFLFFTHLSNRPSCTICPYTNLSRIGDITIGDYWGWERNHAEWNDDLGLNLILVNSQKGLNLFDSVKHQLDYLQTDVDDCLQPQLQTPIRKNPLQDVFFRDFSDKGIKYVIYKYGDRNLMFRMKSFLSNIKRKLIHI